MQNVSSWYTAEQKAPTLLWSRIKPSWQLPEWQPPNWESIPCPGTANLVCKGTFIPCMPAGLLCALHVLVQGLWEMSYNILERSWTIRNWFGVAKNTDLIVNGEIKSVLCGQAGSLLQWVSVYMWVHALAANTGTSLHSCVTFFPLSELLCWGCSSVPSPLQFWCEQKKQNHIFLKRSSSFHLLLLICCSEATPVQASSEWKNGFLYCMITMPHWKLIFKQNTSATRGWDGNMNQSWNPQQWPPVRCSVKLKPYPEP